MPDHRQHARAIQHKTERGALDKSSAEDAAISGPTRRATRRTRPREPPMPTTFRALFIDDLRVLFIVFSVRVGVEDGRHANGGALKTQFESLEPGTAYGQYGCVGSL